MTNTQEIKIGDKVLVIGDYGSPKFIGFIKGTSLSYVIVKEDCFFSEELLIPRWKVEKINN